MAPKRPSLCEEEDDLEVESIIERSKRFRTASANENHSMFFRPAKRGMEMIMGSFYIPKDNELMPLGQDAYFICEEKQTFGLADGVGGWLRRGIDAGIYARELMTNSLIALCDIPKEAVDPKTVLKDAYSTTNAQGSSTACVVTLKDDSLYAANVGDSGFMQFRGKKLIYQSPEQQRCFNCPYQLGNGDKSDRPEIAEELEVKVEAGDIIVAGTDGLLDNVFPSEIEEILSRIEGEICPENLAETIAECALYNSFDKFSESPFARAAKKARYNHVGGKIDDITVIVAKVEVSLVLL